MLPEMQDLNTTNRRMSTATADTLPTDFVLDAGGHVTGARVKVDAKTTLQASQLSKYRYGMSCDDMKDSSFVEELLQD